MLTVPLSIDSQIKSSSFVQGVPRNMNSFECLLQHSALFYKDFFQFITLKKCDIYFTVKSILLQYNCHMKNVISLFCIKQLIK